MLFVSNYVIYVKLCQIMSNYDIHVKLCQIIPFMSNHSIHVKSVIHEKSYHSCQIMSFVSNHVTHVISLFREIRKAGGGGKIYLPKPSATALLSGQRQFIHVKSRQIMLFVSNYVICVKLCQIMSYHSIHVKSFMSNHIIHVKSCHLCQIMSLMSFVIRLFRKFSNAGGGVT
jgi:predicted transcriptional regulator